MSSAVRLSYPPVQVTLVSAIRIGIFPRIQSFLGWPQNDQKTAGIQSYEPRHFTCVTGTFFTERLLQQRNASPHTIACYRDTFRLLHEDMRLKEAAISKTRPRKENIRRFAPEDKLMNFLYNLQSVVNMPSEAVGGISKTRLIRSLYEIQRSHSACIQRSMMLTLTTFKLQPKGRQRRMMIRTLILPR